MHPFDGADWLIAALAGLGAGVVNGIAGGGSLVSFPVLLLLGYPALTANVTSSIGIWPGYVGGSAGFRREIKSIKGRLYELSGPVIGGAVVGGILLLTTPQHDFRALAPWLVLFASLLFAVQPFVAKRLRQREQLSTTTRAVLYASTFLAAIYGAYFGAGLGVIMLGVLGLCLTDSLITINGLRAALALVINTVAAIIFIIHAPVAWHPAAAMVVTSLIGGFVGSQIARKVPIWLLRTIVISIGTATGISLLIS